LYIFKTHKFRKELFRKEKELELETRDIKEWMEWKYTKDLPSTAENVENRHHKSLDDPTTELSDQSILFAELRELFENQKLYLDPELNVKTVIKILGTNQKYLYHAINENSDSNFRSFLNRYRVDEAKRIIEQKIPNAEILNFSEIYAMVGFNSSVSFYRAFKSVTGLKPKEYASEVRKTLLKINHG
jgi:AraC-like DNA-binding protein